MKSVQKRVLSLLLTLCLVLTQLPGTARAAGSSTDIPYASINGNVYRLDKENHIKYMNGVSNVEFAPYSYLTRAEAAQLIYNLLAQKPPVIKQFRDVGTDAWYSQAVNSLYSAGILHGKYDATSYSPDALISRAEFFEILCYFEDAKSSSGKSFTDVPNDYPLYEYVLAVAANGWISGYEDGTFKPDDPLNRAEAATVLNRVLGRAADTDTINASKEMRLFIDVDNDMWAYPDIMEASVSHLYTNGNAEHWTDFTREAPGLTPGCHMYHHYLYYIDETTGMFVRDREVKGYTFDKNGRYTTGNAEADANVHAIVAGLCTNEPGSEENLHKVYDYVRDNFVYQKRAHIARGAKGWELEYGVPMLRTHYGNCYSWAAVFMFLARSVGFEAYCQSGAVGYGDSDHGWTEIMFDGEWRVFDPELEHANKGRWSFYKITHDNGFKPYFKYEA